MKYLTLLFLNISGFASVSTNVFLQVMSWIQIKAPGNVGQKSPKAKCRPFAPPYCVTTAQGESYSETCQILLADLELDETELQVPLNKEEQNLSRVYHDLGSVATLKDGE